MALGACVRWSFEFGADEFPQWLMLAQLLLVLLLLLLLLDTFLAVSAALLRTILFIDDTEGMLSLSQMRSSRSRLRISHANIVGFDFLYAAIASTTCGVATFGFEPPMTPGRMLPVSRNLFVER